MINLIIYQIILVKIMDMVIFNNNNFINSIIINLIIFLCSNYNNIYLDIFITTLYLQNTLSIYDTIDWILYGINIEIKSQYIIFIYSHNNIF